MLLELDETTFDKAVANGVAIIDFWAPWCGPCKKMAPIMDRIAKNNPNLIVAKVDIDKSPNIAQRYNILSIPTVLILKDGAPAEQTVGVTSEAVIMGKVASLG
jgi:thioredoxin 1